MNTSYKKLLVTLMIIQFMLILATASPVVTVRGLATRTVRIIDADTGLTSITLGSETEPMPPGGYTFTVNVTLDGLTEDLYTYQAGLRFNNTQVKCTAAWIDKNDPNFVFYRYKSEAVIPPAEILNEFGYLYLGASLIFHSLNVSEGLLCQVNFTAQKKGFTLVSLSEDPDETFLAKWGGMHLIDIPFNIGESLSVTVLTGVSPPVPSFTFHPPNPKVNEIVIFDASASYDPDGNITDYVWLFGDGENATTTDTTITHVFRAPAVYLVNLTLFDNDGYTSSLVQSLLVGGVPYVNFTYEPTEILALTVVTFNASRSYDPDGNITDYVWLFGDGENATTTDTTITHMFVENGVYFVNLTVFDNDGLHNSTTLELFIGIRPVPSFTYSPEFPNPDEPITFDASSTDPGEEEVNYITWYIWDFGDRLPGELPVEINATDVENAWTTTHTYIGQGGGYPVVLTVFNDDGLYASTTKIVNVTTIKVDRPHSGADWNLYAVATTTIVIVAAVAVVFYRRRPEKELPRRERYRVI